ncbi:MAG: phosphoribosyltransferase family protein [Solirubrobacterales bacterium]
MEFADRTDAGRRLGARVSELDYETPVVVGMPRGGVPVAVEVARSINAPLDIVVVRKIGVPRQPEYAVGAVAEGGVVLVNRSGQALAGVSDEALAQVIDRERDELLRRASVYRAECPPLELANRTVILVDDGLATGLTAAAAARQMRERGAARVVLAVPVCSEESLRRPPDAAIDEVVCLTAPHDFYGVGMWYRDFSQVRDDEVLALLREARAFGREPSPGGATGESEIEINAGSGIRLQGTLAVPADARGVVVFAHGSGSSRTSPRNRMVAELLNASGFATLLFDLLDPLEAADRGNVFDIPLLGSRLVAATDALGERSELQGLPIAYFGASTGAAAALWAAAELGPRIAAVVSRGGRPDLAGPRLERVVAPTLLIVGGDDHVVIDLNREAMRRMSCPVEIVIIEGSAHLFEESGALERVADEACAWFTLHLAAEAQRVSD